MRCYPCERQQAFFDAHLHAFEFFGGIFPVLIYDNLTSAVRKVLRGKHREEQEAFVAFRSYHSFEARFCTPGQGHEKCCGFASACKALVSAFWWLKLFIL